MVDLRTSLKDLTLEGVKERDVQIGVGAYGVVKEYVYQGLRCAGKTIHKEFREADSEQSTEIALRFETECNLLSKQRHPCIVLFMGVYFKPGENFPSLLMEYLPMSLCGALEKYPAIPLYIKNVILYDVACGLSYLHSQKPPLVHRDLTSKNVLLSENSRAKIADLGLAKIISNTAAISPCNLTKVPGNVIFMPPEAFSDDPKYDESLDMFSFGNLILNTINQRWPNPKHNIAEDGTTILNEVERRKSCFDLMGSGHSLRSFTERCLHDKPHERPHASQAVEKFFGEINASPPPFTNALQMIFHINELSNETRRLTDRVQSLERENEDLTASVKVHALEMACNSLALTSSVSGVANGSGGEAEAKQDHTRVIRGENMSLKNEIIALKEKLRDKVVLLEPEATIEWADCPPLPQPRKHTQAVEFKGKVYVGSGYSTDDDSSHLLYCYDVEKKEWSDSPESKTRYFAMTVFNNSILLISGKEKDSGKAINGIQHLSEGNKWVFYNSDEMMDINTARMGAVAVSSALNIIVAGGFNDSGNRMSSVEVYDNLSKMWFFTSKLPARCAELKSALVHGDQWYLLGGANQFKNVYKASLKQLAKDTTEEWTLLPQVQYEFSSVAIFGGNLIAFGGGKDRLTGYNHYSEMYVYNKYKKMWVHFADLKEPVSKSTGLTLGNGELMIIGGRNRTSQELNSVKICSLVYHDEQN